MFGSVKLFGIISVGLAAGGLTVAEVRGQGRPVACVYQSQDKLNAWTNPQAVVNYVDTYSGLFEEAEHPWGEKRRLTKLRPDGAFELDITAAVSPFTCAHDYTREELKAGRLIARINADAAYNPKDKDTPPVPAGVSYVWVEFRPGTGPSSGWKAAIIPKGDPTNTQVVGVVYQAYAGPARGFSEARWVFDPTDDHLWASCAQNGCCTVKWS